MKVITALATPFSDGKVNWKNFEKLLLTQQEVDGVLCAGTTAEGALLSAKEIETMTKTAKATLPKAEIWVGISDGETNKAVKQTEKAICFGADGVLVTPPSFFKCTEKGFEMHAEKICKAANGKQVMLYNAPTRCGYELWSTAVKRLAERFGRQLCIKDAGCDIKYAKKLSGVLPVFCGNDNKLFDWLSVGARGIVSVVSNFAPLLVKKLCQQSNQNSEDRMATEIKDRLQQMQVKADDDKELKTGCDFEKAKSLDITRNAENCHTTLFRDELRKADDSNAEREKFLKLSELSFLEINPIPIKYMLYKKGIFDTYEMRLPLTSVTAETRKNIDEYLSEL